MVDKFLYFIFKFKGLAFTPVLVQSDKGNEMAEQLTFDDLALIAGGHTAFQLLWAGVDVGLFSTLSGEPGLTVKQIETRLELQEQPTKILVRGLATLRLIEKEGDGFRNSTIVEELLVPDSPSNMIDVLGWQKHIVYPGEMDFVEALRQNKNVGLRHFPGEEDNLYARIAHDPELEKIFHAAMSSLSNSANQLLVAKVDFGKINHLVDAGGGDGTNAIALGRANPHLRITVFDAPSVCELAKSNIEKAGLTARVTTQSGNFFSDDFPGDIDGILLSHMLTIWSPEKDTALLRRCRQALPAGGRVLIFSMMANDDGIGPMVAALGSPYFLTIATGEGMLYSWSDYEEFLSAAGFAQTERYALPRNHGVLVGIK